MPRFRLVALSVGLTSAFWLAIGAWLVPRSADDPAIFAPQPGAEPSAAQKLPSTVNHPLPDRELKLGTVDYGLLIPVAGARVDDLVDSFAKSNAIEIAAPVGMPVIAAAPGIVEKLSDRGGTKSIHVRSPDRTRLYEYALLGSIASGVSEGVVIGAGDQIGSVGAAEGKPAHLRFAVLAIRPNGNASKDTQPINPYSLLGGRPHQSR